jgi:stringent starvation protein B
MRDAHLIPSTKPYLIRALYEWCTDNGFTPFLAVQVDATVRVPMEFVKDGEIVLNISFDATSALKLGDDFIEFKGRFGGVAKDIFVPVSRVLAIYARENGQGMAFPVASVTHISSDSVSVDSRNALELAADSSDSTNNTSPESGPDAPTGTVGKRPALKRIK